MKKPIMPSLAPITRVYSISEMQLDWLINNRFLIHRNLIYQIYFFQYQLKSKNVQLTKKPIMPSLAPITRAPTSMIERCTIEETTNSHHHTQRSAPSPCGQRQRYGSILCETANKSCIHVHSCLVKTINCYSIKSQEKKPRNANI